MSDDEKKDYDAEVQKAFGQYIAPKIQSEKLVKVWDLAALIPGAAPIVKLASFMGGWWSDSEKTDRVFPLLKALSDKINDTDGKQSEYVKKEEFRDVFKETLERIASEAEPERREWLKNVFLKIVDDPKQTDENRLFLRLVGELSTNSHKVLGVLDRPFTDAERGRANQDMTLSERSGVALDRIQEVKAELTRTGLVDPERFKGPPNEMKRLTGNPLHSVGIAENADTKWTQSYDYFLTRLGREFLSFRRGTD